MNMFTAEAVVEEGNCVWCVWWLRWGSRRKPKVACKNQRRQPTAPTTGLATKVALFRQHQ